MHRLAFFVVLLSVTAGCGETQRQEPLPDRDPQVAQALDSPLMTDPDLSSLNEAAAALTVESDASLPVLPASPEAAAAARSEAALIVGGADKLVPIGEPEGTDPPLARDAKPEDQLAALMDDHGCTDEPSRSAIWAARMPAVMPIYPRGATVKAAGSDERGCRVRLVAFTTPVSAADILAFYANRGRAAGATPKYVRSGEDLQLRGDNRSISYDVRVRTEGDHTLVRLATVER